ncbi:MAG: hypothetical protein JSR42_03975 [Proteobacteria bacterium]|nr:hypothetical protein [Pseudomonadota bacterium]
MTKFLIGALLGITALSVQAAQPYGPTDNEISALPELCAVKLRQANTPQEKAYATKYGVNWLHMHHYCFALNFLNRGRMSGNQKDIRASLDTASREFGYVLTHVEKTFWMRPQISVEAGRVSMRMKDSASASRLFLEAIAQNPAYESAYQGLIEVHRQTGDKAGVLELATSGLRYLPNSAMLQKAYLDAGGKKPFPEPIAKPNQQEKPADEELRAEPASGGERAQSSARTDAPSDADASRADVVERGCRFCPPEEIQRKWRESFGEPPTK